MIDKISVNGTMYAVSPVPEGEDATGTIVTVDGVVYQIGAPIAIEKAVASQAIEKVQVNGVIYDIADVEGVEELSDALTNKGTALEKADEQIKTSAARYDGAAFSADGDKVRLRMTSLKNTEAITELPAATTEKAGVMAAKDRKRIEKSPVFSTVNVSSDTAKKLRDFLQDIRIYGAEMPDISLFSVNNGKDGKYQLKFTYLDESKGVYYIEYEYPIQEYYIKTKTADDKVVELFVDWSVIPKGTEIVAASRTDAVISGVCLQPITTMLSKRVSDLALSSLATGQDIRENVNRLPEEISGKYVNSRGALSESSAFNAVKCNVNAGELFKLSINNITSSTPAYSYAIYSSLDIYDATTLLKIGPRVINDGLIDNNGEYIISIPQDGVVLIQTLLNDDWVKIREIHSADAILRKIAEEILRATNVENKILSRAADVSMFEFEPALDAARLLMSALNGQGDYLELPAATTKLAGIMTAEDKRDLEYKLIKLEGFGTMGAGNTGVTSNGQYFVSTATNKLYVSSGFKSKTDFIATEVPFLKGAIYTYNNELHVYDGQNVVYADWILRDKVDDIREDIKKFESKFEIKEEITSYSTLSGKYVTYNGDIAEYAAYISRVYDISQLTKLSLDIEGLADDTGARMYAIYSDAENLSSETALLVGGKLGISSNGENIINIPKGGKTLVVTTFGTSNGVTYYISECVSNPEQYIEDKIQNAIAPTPNACYVEVEGDTLKYRTKYDKDKDLIISFKPCMNNELVTFTNVGLAPNTDKYPKSEFPPSLEDYHYVTLLNNPGSDNIGPFNIYKDANVGDGVGGFCGANHCYSEIYGENQVRTAKSDWHKFYIDGILIEDGFKGYGKAVKVVTENTIFDPRIAPTEGETILSSPLITEMMAYTIIGTQVEVCATHRFLKDAKALYYGQQSVFINKTQIITPQGANSEWTDVANVVNFTKEEYPNYRAVSIKSDRGYENDILLDCGLGTRSMVGADTKVFHYSSNKTYTTLLNGNEIKQNDVIYWAGVYSWGCVVDDENNYIYRYQTAGKKFLTICSKKAYSNVIVAAPIDIVNSNINATGENITVEPHIGEYIILNAEGVGSVTVEIE